MPLCPTKKSHKSDFFSTHSAISYEAETLVSCAGVVVDVASLLTKKIDTASTAAATNTKTNATTDSGFFKVFIKLSYG